MEITRKTFCLDVKGDFACFTRPEMKVERVSYDVITPSAARAIFSAIFWKPAIKWNVKKIEVLKPVKWISVRRNEVGAVAGKNPIMIEDARQQRAGLFLRDVHYRIYAEMEFIPVKNRVKTTRETPDVLVENEERELIRKDENPGKYHAMFDRRAKKGQCFNQPYLGCREFSCNFKFIAESDLENEIKENPPVEWTSDLGFMLYDMDFSDPSDIKPAFFRAQIKNGVLEIPAWESEEVRK
ncbi:CRISPR-associated protein, Cas5d family [Fibrobacter sp. UWH5]|uniref:type I-C CRISPR-associated protein Cas5c n=1 Tax=Fibrobacter sp. UWH5 TaxID=1896211 RepID=UPI00091E71F1|nr:type I-C CRISPR-associated protein Cas5c [Fibrobacter sp. UWH5]SHL12854.1 CRISPR-associated protein, Cas5d family [Fibrobacter sp. UWH5]